MTTTTTKHTPGPWYSGGHVVNGPDLYNVKVQGHEALISYFQPICDCSRGDEWEEEEQFLYHGNGFLRRVPGYEESVANAKLISAAPDMLEALEAIVDQADAQFQAGDRHATFNKAFVDTIRTAIAKARGVAP